MFCCKSAHFMVQIMHSSLSLYRFGVHRIGQPLSQLLGHDHLWFLWLSAPSVSVCHRNQHGVPGQSSSSPYPGLSTPLQSTGHASHPVRPGRLHAGKRAYLPLLPHATLPPLFPARALRCHPGTAPFFHSHDPVRMIPATSA